MEERLLEKLYEEETFFQSSITDLGPQKGPSSLARILAQQNFINKELSMLNFLIFSKDRVCQLDLLLRGIKTLFQSSTPYSYTVTILYTYSENHKDSYENCKIEYPNVNWVLEKNFQEQTKEILKSHKYTCLLTDDTVFFRRFSLLSFPKINECFSWRLGYNTLVQDHINKTYQPLLAPDYYCDNIISWNPNNYPNWCNYGYPFSFDGHVYLSSTLLDILKDKTFNSTNDMEGTLHSNREKIAKITSNVHSSCVNVPCNNISGLTAYGKEYEYNMNFLKNVYMTGKRIRLDSFNKAITGCHQEFEFNFYSIEG